MNFERRKKYTGFGRTIVKNEKRIDINFDISVLNLLCSYILSENRNIRRSHLINLRNLMEILNIDIYINDIEKMKRINLIKKGLEGRLLKNIKDQNILMKYINGGITEDDIIELSNFTMMNNDELAWINETISETLKFSYIYNDIDILIDICTRFKACDYKARGLIVEEMENHLKSMLTKFRRANATSVTDMTFTLKNGLFEEVVKDIHEQLTNPSNKLITAMQGLNELLGGGFENSRVYLFLGLTGGGKSLTLLDIAYQLKIANAHYKPKDPTKIPVVVYMTMENNIKETVARLFSMATGKGKMENYSVEEVIDLLRRDGELYLADDSPVDILIKFVPDSSVDTSYLYELTEDLEDEGYEVICLIQDHIKKIRSCHPGKDIRLELGSIVNEFKVFSALKDIPVITNSHLNRDAASKIDEASKANKGDLIRMLGRSNIGESMLMLDNVDGGFLLCMEFDNEGNKYMGFKAIKRRYECTFRDTIFQPYYDANGIKLVNDLSEAVPVFRETLKVLPTESNLYNNGLQQQSQYQNNIVQLDDLLDDKDNIFSSTRYTQNTILEMPIEEEIQVSEPIVAQQPLRQAVYFYNRPPLNNNTNSSIA